MKISAKTKICAIIGDPVDHSLSPIMHNAGYESLGIDFVFVGLHVKKESLREAVAGIRTLGIRGVSITIPHKQEALKYVDSIDKTAEKIGAINTIVNNDGELIGINTDWMGVRDPLENLISIRNKRVGIIGAGGAARAASYAVKSKGAVLNIFNRTLDRAGKLANDFGANVFTLDEIAKLKEMDIVINATSLGLHEDDDLPVSNEYISSNQIIFDLVYTKNGKTKFIEEAEKKKAIVLTGIEMLLAQGYEQFKLFTGHNPPKDAMRKVLP
jgi:shikimate dehydrogenase